MIFLATDASLQDAFDKLHSILFEEVVEDLSAFEACSPVGYLQCQQREGPKNMGRRCQAHYKALTMWLIVERTHKVGWRHGVVVLGVKVGWPRLQILRIWIPSRKGPPKL